MKVTDSLIAFSLIGLVAHSLFLDYKFSSSVSELKTVGFSHGEGSKAIDDSLMLFDVPEQARRPLEEVLNPLVDAIDRVIESESIANKNAIAESADGQRIVGDEEFISMEEILSGERVLDSAGEERSYGEFIPFPS